MVIFWFGLFVVGFGIALSAYWIALRKNLMAIVDLVWTLGLGLSVVAYYQISDLMFIGRHLAILLIILFWSFRLSYHLFADRILPGKEDPRYRNLQERWGNGARRNFAFVFLIQIPFVALFLFPISIALCNPMPWQITDWLAVAVALVALLGEFLADHQLARFKENSSNEGGVCKDGLWKYSRHPNYFFEWFHWWAYTLFAWGYSDAWWALSGPIAMYVFLRFITGVPPAEYSSVKSRGEAYRHYQKTTNAFFPWIPRKVKI